MSSGLGCVEHHTKQTATNVALVSHLKWFSEASKGQVDDEHT